MVSQKIQVMMDYITTAVVARVMENENLPVDEAMKAFFNSQVFDLLCDIETGLYRESGGYVYDLYRTECEYGELVQLEI